MTERKCLMTFYPTDCKDNCFNCECGGAEATKDMYVSIHDVQRICAIVGGAADTDDGEHIAEVIRNNLENMVMPAADVQPVKHGRWINHRINDEKSLLHGAIKDTTCSECGKSTPYKTDYCMHCGARMDGGIT